MNEINNGYALKHLRGAISDFHPDGSAFCAQWTWRAPFESRIRLLWDVINAIPMATFRSTPSGNTIIDNHPALSFRGSVMYLGLDVLRRGTIPPIAQSFRITRSGGW